MSTHIAILLTNPDRSEFTLSWPNDGEKVAAGIHRVRPHWDCRVHAACFGELPASPESLGGVIITGSPSGVNDPLPWIANAEGFIQSLREHRVPTIGLCFGHQLVAKALGGQVERAHDWGLGVGRFEVTEKAPWMQPPRDSITLFAAHQDQVTQLPPGARLLGSSDFCPIGLYAVGDARGDHMLGVQYHPELSREFMQSLLDHLEDELPAGVVPRARPQIQTPVDADVFFEWMARFIELKGGTPS